MTDTLFPLLQMQTLSQRHELTYPGFHSHWASKSFGSHSSALLLSSTMTTLARSAVTRCFSTRLSSFAEELCQSKHSPLLTLFMEWVKGGDQCQLSSDPDCSPVPQDSPVMWWHLHFKIYLFVWGQVSPAGIKELSLAFLDSVQASGVMRRRWEWRNSSAPKSAKGFVKL